MLRVCLLLASTVQVTLASFIPMRAIKFCSVLFSVVVHAGCDKQDSLMRGGLRDKRSKLLVTLHQSSMPKP